MEFICTPKSTIKQEIFNCRYTVYKEKTYLLSTSVLNHSLFERTSLTQISCLPCNSSWLKCVCSIWMGMLFFILVTYWFLIWMAKNYIPHGTISHEHNLYQILIWNNIKLEGHRWLCWIFFTSLEQREKYQKYHFWVVVGESVFQVNYSEMKIQALSRMETP